MSRNIRSFMTSLEVFNRILWSGEYNPSEFSVCYKDRFKPELQETPLLTFRDEDFIPWHRVWMFKHNDTIVWNRKEMIDNIGGTTRISKNKLKKLRKKSARK